MKRKPLKFKKTPVCEICKKEPAITFSCIGTPAKLKWKFAGDCSAKTEFYYIQLTAYFKSPAATVDWLAHMHEKNWFDASDFLEMIHRFRKATDSEFAL